MTKDEQSSNSSFDISRLYLSTPSLGDDNAGHDELNALLSQPELIPASWGKGVLVFADARTTGESDNPCVLSLAWTGEKWEERNFYLGDDDWLHSDRFVHVSPAS